MTVNDVRIEYNITLDNDKLTSIHLQGTYEIAIDNWHVYNNTCTETSGSIHSPMYAMIKFNGTGGSGDYYLRNNAFYMDGCNRFAQDWTTFDFDHNDYYLINSVGPGLNITPDGTDITGNPLFANLGGTSDVDYKLQSDSPCVNAGVDLNLTLDYFDVVVPQGTDEDMGAAECVFGHKGSVKPGNKLIIKPGGKVIIKEPLISWLNIIGGLIK